jgi:hypothetical protein
VAAGNVLDEHSPKKLVPNPGPLRIPIVLLGSCNGMRTEGRFEYIRNSCLLKGEDAQILHFFKASQPFTPKRRFLAGRISAKTVANSTTRIKLCQKYSAS